MAHTNIKKRFAVHFNEGSGPGYLLIDCLSVSGMFSRTMLVLSLANNEIQVRKLHHVQLFNPDNAVQCSDERQAYLPAKYTDNEGHTIKKYYRYTTPVTIWQFCNGSTVEDIYLLWDESPKQLVPEAVIWHFLESLLRTLIDLNVKGIAHADIHERNLLFHWRDKSHIPDIFIADFGLARTYPVIDDEKFRKPWIGEHNNQGQPMNSTLTQKQILAINTFYAIALQDHKDAILIIQSLITTTRNPKYEYGPDPDDLFAVRSRHSQGVHHVGPTLIHAVHTWADIVASQGSLPPPQLMQRLKTLLLQVQHHTTLEKTQFLAHPASARQQTGWMRPAPYSTRPALWKDPTPLFTAIDPDQDLPPMNKHDGNDPWIVSNDDDDDDDDNHVAAADGAEEDHWTAFADGDWRYDRPRIEVWADSMSRAVTLRKGEFRVVEVAYDTQSHRVRVGGVVESVEGVGSVSP